MKYILISSMLAAGLFTAASCYAEGPAPQYAAEDDNGDDLVEVSPGVEVIADYDEPIFFADDYYWVNRGGIWYSSPWYRGGWVRAERPPTAIVSIRNPQAYVHYRPAGYARHARVSGGYTSHAQYHASHPAAGGVRVRAAVHGGRRHR